MSKIQIIPSPLMGTVQAPPSKSIAHRAVIAASLADGISSLYNVDLSDDIKATVCGMRALGALIEINRNGLTIQGIKSKKEAGRPDPTVIDCIESGSTLRFLVPVSLALGGSFLFTGKGNLGKRPLNPYYEILDRQDISYHSTPNSLNLSVSGALSAGSFSLPGNISSQFITGLLFALPVLSGDSEIMVTSPLESKAYVDLTLQALADFGITVTNHDYRSFKTKGNQRYLPRNYTVESDYSQAAFFLCAGALGSDITVAGLNNASLQGDKEILPVLQRMGGEMSSTSEGIKVSASKLHGTQIDASEIPDIIPVLAATACAAEGKTVIRNAGRLRMKECDRFAAVIEEMTALGAHIKADGSNIVIEGKEQLEGGCEVQSHSDHRMAMTLAVIAQKCKKPIVLNDYECISKSYPRFFEDFKMLGGKTR